MEAAPPGPASSPAGGPLTRQRIALAVVTAGWLVVVALLALRAEGSDAMSVVDLRGPILTEVMPSNGSILADADGDHPDWIEVHNPTSAPISMLGFHLSDDDTEPLRWAFPDVEIAPGGHLVVFASGKDRADPDGELHTDFALARDGEPVLLSREADPLIGAESPQVVDRLEITEPLPRDVAIGRDPERPGRVCYFATPTPGERNAPACFDDLDLGAPSLSHPSGFHDDPFELVIEAHDPDVTILYTLDGSFPDLDANPGRTHVYQGPLTIEDRSAEPDVLAAIPTTISPGLVDWATPRTPERVDPVQKGTVVRARTLDGAESVATFFVGEHLQRDHLPVLSLVLDPDHLFGPEGLYVPGRVFEEALASPGFDPQRGWQTPANYHQRGREWERPPADDLRDSVVLEHCPPAASARTCDHQRQVGVRIHGNHSRILPQKSLRLYARNDYGDRRFDHDLFDGQAPEGHRRLLLRNSGQDNQVLMFTDAYLQSLMTHFAADTQAYRPTVLFINGEYWGVHNLRERYDAHYLEVVHGADPAAVTLLDRDHAVSVGDPDGNAHFLEVQRRIIEAPRVNDDLIAEVEEAIDLDSYFDHVVGHVFIGNRDWPHNNVRVWREADGPHAVGEGPRDGRWRWLIFDLDHVGGNVHDVDPTYDVLRRRLAPTDDPTRDAGYPAMFTRLMEHEATRDRFLSRFADHLNASFAPTRTLDQLDEVLARLEPEIETHAERWWAGFRSVDAWEADVERLRRFMRHRPRIQRAHLIERFDLDGLATLQVQHDPSEGTVYVNSLPLTTSTPGVDVPERWYGTYFAGVPITLTAVPADGYRFVGWEDAGGSSREGEPTAGMGDTDSNVEVVLNDGERTALRAVFEPT